MSYESKYMYRRASDAPRQLPFGGYSRGVFNEIVPWAMPGYVRAEPDGVDGLGQLESVWTEGGTSLSSNADRAITLFVNAAIAKLPSWAQTSMVVSALRDYLVGRLRGKISETVPSAAALAATMKAALPSSYEAVPGAGVALGSLVDVMAQIIWDGVFATASAAPEATTITYIGPREYAVSPTAGEVKNIAQDPDVAMTLWYRELTEKTSGNYTYSTPGASGGTTKKPSAALLVGVGAAALLALRLFK